MVDDRDGRPKYLIISGGIGGTKLVQGFYNIVDPSQICVLSNTGDDILRFGLRICPDIDILIYTLAGLIDKEKKWGLDSDSYQCIEFYAEHYRKSADWFHLGDKDIATHLYRTQMLSEGMKLSEVTEKIAKSLGIKCRILPMSEDYIPTMIKTEKGLMHFEEYFVKNKTEPRILGIEYGGGKDATLPDHVETYFEDVEKIIIAPSNPILSIRPILAIPRYRALFHKHREKVYAVTPIISGTAVKGPTVKNLREFGIEPTPIGVCRVYNDFISSFILDTAERKKKEKIFCDVLSEMNVTCYWYDTIMSSLAKKKALAYFLINM